jgi:phosphoribosyl 1,2-cyclic phosphodiesterase
MKVKFWGTRGSIPCPRPGCMKYGGDTPCVEVRTGQGNILILDAGTGIRSLGLSLQKDPEFKKKGFIFLSHAHWDHIQGFPFFGPAFDKECKFSFYGQFKLEKCLEDILTGQQEHLYFPVKLTDMGGRIDFVEILEETVQAEDVRVTSRHLNHPGGCLGYRIEDGGRIVTYCTDVEVRPEHREDRLLELAHEADVFIFDSQFTLEDYPKHMGWGHSTWQAGVRIARRANVKELILFHHNPNYNDSVIGEIVEKARKEFPNTIAASRELAIFLREKEALAQSIRKSRPVPRSAKGIALTGSRLYVHPGKYCERLRSEDFFNSVRRRLRKGIKSLVMDFSELEIIDSVNLEGLAQLAERAEEKRIQLYLAGATEFLDSIFAASPGERTYSLIDTVEDMDRRRIKKSRKKMGATS